MRSTATRHLHERPGWRAFRLSCRFAGWLALTLLISVAMQGWGDRQAPAAAMRSDLLDADRHPDLARPEPGGCPRDPARGHSSRNVDHIDHLLPLDNLHVSLPQGLAFVLEQQADWHIRKQMTGAETIPNYLGFVATGPLREIRESSVGIVK